MKAILASLAATGLLLGASAALAVEAPYSAPQPDRIGAPSQAQGSVPAAPSAAESYSSGQLAAPPGDAESKDSATMPQSDKGASTSGEAGSPDSSGGG